MGWFGRIINHIPVVGHAKGVYHLLKGDQMSADQAFRDATVGTLAVATTVAVLSNPAVGAVLLKVGGVAAAKGSIAAATIGAATIAKVAAATLVTSTLILKTEFVQGLVVEPLAYVSKIVIGTPCLLVADAVTTIANLITRPDKTVEPPTKPDEPNEPSPMKPNERVEPPMKPDEPIEPPTKPSEPVEPSTKPNEPVEPTTKPEKPAEQSDNDPPLSGSTGGDKDPYTPPPASHQNFEENRIYSMTLKELIDLLKEKIKEIHHQSRASNSDADNRKDIRKLFREMYCLIDAIIRCGATLSLDVNDDLVINDPNNQNTPLLTIERSVTEYDRIDIPEHFYMDSEINRLLETNSFTIPSGDTFCPRILQVEINSRGVWRLLPANCSTKSDAIYGIRCRLCPGRGTIKYVGQNRVNDRGRRVYNLHNRMCCGHRSYLEKKIKLITGDDIIIENDDRELIEILIDLDDYDDGEEKEIDKKKKKILRLDTDIDHCLGNKVKAKFAFREIFDVILLPTGRSMTEARSPAQIRRSWEIFWQWIFRARDTRGGHSKR